MSTRTTSGVLAVLAGILVVPGAAQALDLPATTTSTSEAAPPTTTEKPATTTTAPAPPTTVPTITEPVPPIPPITTAPSTATEPPATAATPPVPTTGTTATVPRGNRKNAPEGEDADKAQAEQAKQTRAEKRREARAAKKQSKQQTAAEKRAEAKAAREAREKAEREAAAAATTTGETPAPDPAAAVAGDDPAAMTQNQFAPELLEPGLASQVPNFFIDQFRIPPFLLPIYQAAGIQYGIRWEILAAINEIETDYGRNLNISSAGAQGWMQFMPATWAQYGLDANGDDKADPYNPVDAIFSAARYLKAAGSDTDIRKAIFAYNHADWYVNSVLARARLISVLPTDLIGSLSGLTQGIFPVTGEASYVGAEDGDVEIGAAKSVRNAEITAKAGADAVAVQDGTVTAIGETVRLGKFVQVRDVYGNLYTYGHLGEVAETYAAAKDEAETEDAPQTGDATGTSSDPAPRGAASNSDRPAGKAKAGKGKKAQADKAAPAAPEQTSTDSTPAPSGKERVYANPDYAAASSSPSAAPHGDLAATDPSTVPSKPDPLLTPELPAETTPSVEASTKGMVIRPLRKGSRVVSGTKLGTVATTEAYNDARGRKRAAADAAVDTSAGVGEDVATDTAETLDPTAESGRMTFEIRPAGKGAPRIDPRPILEGWQLLQTSSVYAANESEGDNAMFSRSANATAGQVLLMTKAQLQRRVLADKSLDIYAVGRQQIAAGLIDRRVLATLAYLSANGHKVAVSSLSRPGAITSSGNVSDHSSGNAIDIAAVDGEVISAATQGTGSITDTTIKRLLQLQGTVRPHQIISLMTPADFGGASNILALPDHDDHIHVGFQADATDDPLLGQQLASALKPGQWDDLIDRLGKISNPKVSAKPSKYALKVKKQKKTAAERSLGLGD
ncbi:MAG: lytic murein transglycosylase [Patulibacter sp.]